MELLEYLEVMQKTTLQRTMNALRARIIHLNKRYHEDSVSEVLDSVYDSLKRELVEVEEALEVNDPTSPTKTVGATAGSNGFEVVKHITPMRSLGNVYNTAELMEWIGTLPTGTKITKEPKLDGLALDLLYFDGMLKRAITRGDGFEGEDVTENAIGVWGVQVSLGDRAVKGYLEVRGEVVVFTKDFQKINNMLELAGTKKYANPRNYAAGSLRLKDSSQVPYRRLTFIAYDYIYPTDLPVFDGDRMDLLAHMGFKTTRPVYVYISDNPQEVENDIETLLTECESNRKTLPYEIDGEVFKVADPDVRRQLGERSNSPRWATAYKFPAEEGVTTLEMVHFQVGKSGAVTPVAEINPIHLCGVTISKVTLHNVAEIERLDVKLFDHVIVTRRGDVIPKIESVVTELRIGEELRVIYPSKCPSCGTELERHSHSLYCPNNAGCPDQAVGRLVHFVSRDGMNIKDLGAAAVKEFVKHGLISSFSSLFYLQDEDLKLIHPNSPIMRAKVLANILKAKTQPLRKVLHAISIPDVGEGTAERLAMNFKNMEQICDATLKQLEDIPDIGPETAQSIVDACVMNRREYLTYDKLFTYVEDAPPDPSIVRDLEGKRVVVTGTNFDGLSRSQMESSVKARGAKLTSSVSANLDILFAGTGPGPEKVRAAMKLGFVQDGIKFLNPRGSIE